MFYDVGGWLTNEMVLFLLWGTVALMLAILAVRALWSMDDLSERPLEIARRRYAKGEITREEFERIRDDLSRPKGHFHR